MGVSRVGVGRSVRLALISAVLAAGTFAAQAAISVPWIAQKASNECGRAVLASLAARRGGNVEAAYARLPPPADAGGYSISDMRRLGPRVGVSLSVRSPRGLVIAGDCSQRPAVVAHLSSLARTVASGRPVVVPVSAGFGAGHYLVLVGSDSAGFTALDPASPGLRRIDTGSLAGMMCGYGFLALEAR